MEQLKRLLYIFVFYQFAQLPAAAVWQSPSIPFRLKIALMVVLIGTFTILVAEDQRRKISLPLGDIGFKFPSSADMKWHIALALACVAAGLAFFSGYFSAFHKLFPAAYAELAKNNAGILTGLMEWRKNYPVQGTAALIGGLAFLAAAEEYMFRGVIYNYLLKSMGWRGAMILSSAVFAIFHLKVTSIPIYLVGGGLYCWLYRRTGTIFAPTLAHFLYNLGLVLVGDRLVPGS